MHHCSRALEGCTCLFHNTALVTKNCTTSNIHTIRVYDILPLNKQEMVEMPTKLQHLLLDASTFQMRTLSSTAVARLSHQQKSCFV
jgi:hypothetical protein